MFGVNCVLSEKKLVLVAVAILAVLALAFLLVFNSVELMGQGTQETNWEKSEETVEEAPEINEEQPEEMKGFALGGETDFASHTITVSNKTVSPPSVVIPKQSVLMPVLENKDNQVHSFSFFRKKPSDENSQLVKKFDVEPNSFIETGLALVNYELSESELERAKAEIMSEAQEEMIWQEAWVYWLVCVSCGEENNQTEITLEGY